MDMTLISGIAAFGFVMSVTPGPNNVMLMASGAQFGVLRTLPHMSGISFGVATMLLLVGVGMMQVFDLWPVTYDVLKYVSIAYLLYLAWCLARAGEPGADAATARPMTFLQAALFQWVNPKAWVMSLSAISVYAPTRSWAAVVLVAAIVGLVNVPAVWIWAHLGQEVRRWLTNPVRRRVFNWTMAALLVASIYPVL